MSQKFCQNPQCIWCLDVEPSINRLKYAPKPGEPEVEVSRQIIREESSKKEFAFCSTCANVLVLVNDVRTGE